MLEVGLPEPAMIETRARAGRTRIARKPTFQRFCRRGGRDLEVDRVAGLAVEGRQRLGGEVQIGVRMSREADEPGQEVVQRGGGLPLEQCRHPVGQDDEERADRPHRRAR